MPSTTPKQLRFMRMVKARQHGHDVGNASVERAANSMTSSQVDDFSVLKTSEPRRSKTSMRRKVGLK
jgi:hypothetical protein